MCVHPLVTFFVTLTNPQQIKSQTNKIEIEICFPNISKITTNQKIKNTTTRQKMHMA